LFAASSVPDRVVGRADRLVAGSCSALHDDQRNSCSRERFQTAALVRPAVAGTVNMAGEHAVRKLPHAASRVADLGRKSLRDMRKHDRWHGSAPPGQLRPCACPVANGIHARPGDSRKRRCPPDARQQAQLMVLRDSAALSLDVVGDSSTRAERGPARASGGGVPTVAARSREGIVFGQHTTTFEPTAWSSGQMDAATRYRLRESVSRAPDQRPPGRAHKRRGSLVQCSTADPWECAAELDP